MGLKRSQAQATEGDGVPRAPGSIAAEANKMKKLDASESKKWRDFYNGGNRLTLDDPPAEGDEADEDAAAADKKATAITAAPARCRNHESTGCRARRKDACCNEMCFSCCIAAPTGAADAPVCQAHLQEKADKETEERLFQEGFKELHKKTSNRKKTNFYHYEELFQNFGDTVLIWSLHDFCKNKQ